MTKTSLKSKATKGMLWNAVEKLSTQGGQFIIGIVLARILMPADFGLIGMLSIFIAISQIFIDSGMGSGLIQKKNRTDTDFSTVFIFNFAVSTFFYIVLYFAAPLIANFYSMPKLTVLTRVLTINIVINSLAIVQRSRLTINLDFKTIAKVNVVSVLTSGACGIFFAYMGYGVWALVIQNLVRSIVSVIMLVRLSKWNPSFTFSKKSFNTLFKFGSKLLVAGLIAETFRNIYNITIGKIYSAAELGFYTRAKSFAELSAGTVTNVIHQVTYPILASLQDDNKKMISVFSQMIRMSAFIIFPTMTILALVADPFIRLVLTEKWSPAIPLLQWMCFARVFYPVNAININILNAVGRSDLFLKVDLSKLPFTIIALIITLPIGVKAVVIGHVVTSVISFFINAYLPGKLFGYGIRSQIRDIIPVVLISAVTALIVFIVNSFVEMLILKLLIGISTGLIIYIGTSYIFKINELKEINFLVQNLIRQNGKKG
jgi:teichuronic acid exporter